MYRICPALALFALLSAVVAERDREREDDVSSLHRDAKMAAENAQLRNEVAELHAQLQVTKSGAFVKKHYASPAATEELVTSNKTDHNGSVEEIQSSQMGPENISSSSHSAGEAEASVLSADLRIISKAIAEDAGTAAKNIEETRGKSISKDGHTDGKVAFVIYSNSKFFNTRMEWVLATWAKKLPSSRFVVIADAMPSNDDKFDGVNIHQTRCKAIHDHATEMSCKYAEAVIVAQSLMWKHLELEWVYVADDDTYIRTAQVEKALLDQPPSHFYDGGLVLANFGCVSGNCSDLLCGSSGYAANRWAIEVMAGGDPAGFVQEMMQYSNQCRGTDDKGSWGDGGLSAVISDRGIQRRTLEGIYGHMLDKACLEYSLESSAEPLLYHMIRSKPQMEFLHRLFAPVEEQTGSSLPLGAATDGIGGCVEYRGNVQCAGSRSDEDRPWHRGPAKCTRPRMPHMPVLLGVFTLVLLFIILVTFIWAGIRYQHWEGWKLQGMKWHTHPMQGRARFR